VREFDFSRLSGSRFAWHRSAFSWKNPTPLGDQSDAHSSGSAKRSRVDQLKLDGSKKDQQKRLAQ
jgi:hypothetical protein